MSILQMSTSATFLVVAICIIRAIAINKLPKRTFIVLWGIVLSRLLLPVSVASRFSIFTYYSRIKEVSMYTSGYITIPNTATKFIIPNSPFPIYFNDSIFSNYIVLALWSMGFIIAVAFFTVLYFKIRKEFTTSLPVNNSFFIDWLNNNKILRVVQIRVSDKINSPLTYGIIRPVILLPKTTDWSNKQQLHYILSHEFIHIKRFDTLFKIILTIALCIHWFNPIVWIMYILVNRDIELSCDESVIQSIGEDAKSNYAMALICLNKKTIQPIPLVTNFSKYVMEERIQAIMRYRKTSKSAMIIACILITSITVVFTTSAIAETVDADISNAYSVYQVYKTKK